MMASIPINGAILKLPTCYDLKLKVSSNKTTLVLSNTRELNKVPNIKSSTLYTITHGLC